MNKEDKEIKKEFKSWEKKDGDCPGKVNKSKTKQILHKI